MKLKLSTPDIINDRISQIKVFLHVLPLQGSHIPDIVPHKCFTMPDGTKRQWVSYSPSDALQGVALLWLVFVRGKSNTVRYCNTKLVPHIGIQ